VLQQESCGADCCGLWRRLTSRWVLFFFFFGLNCWKDSTWGHSDDETAADDDAVADCEGKYVLSSSVFKKFQEIILGKKPVDLGACISMHKNNELSH
jgi:hypothetical protein